MVPLKLAWKWTFSDPRWVVAASILVTSSSLRASMSNPPDIVAFIRVTTKPETHTGTALVKYFHTEQLKYTETYTANLPHSGS